VLITSIAGASAWLPGTRIVPDGWKQRGSLVGIHAALKYAKQPILLVAWDMPFVTSELLRLVRDRSARSSFAAVPSGESGLEPFCAVYTPKCLPWIEAALAADDLRMTRLLERLPEFENIAASEVAPIGDPARLFFNVNNADDLDEAERLAAAR
jgi:molybdopterin-guanine dinucleotide biosynthesis protein A